MWTTQSKISVFIVGAIVAALLLGLNISKSNAKVLAISIVREKGRLESSKDTLYYRSFNRDVEVDTRTMRALVYLGRNYSTIKVD
jgi:hypothetical protein